MDQWVREQLRQPSTARGLVVLAGGALHLSFDNALTDALAALVIAAIGLWDVLRRGRGWDEPGA